MHTPETFDQLTDEQARTYLDSLGAEYYGTTRYKSDLARDAGMTVPGVANWFRKDGRPSAMVILWMQERIERRRMLGTMQTLAQLMDQVKAYLPESALNGSK